MESEKLRNKINEYIQRKANKEFLEIIDSLIEFEEKKDKSDWWDEISDAEKRDIEEGLAQAERGELISHKEVMKRLFNDLQNKMDTES